MPCARRSDDTDARKATVRRFGRSHRSAQQIHRDRRDGGDRGGSADGRDRPPIPHADLAGGGAGPRPAAHPAHRPPKTGVYLPLTTTTVRGSMVLGPTRLAATLA